MDSHLEHLLVEYDAGRLPVSELFAEVKIAHGRNIAGFYARLASAMPDIQPQSDSSSLSSSSGSSSILLWRLVKRIGPCIVIINRCCVLRLYAAVQKWCCCSVAPEPLLEAVSTSQAAAAATIRPHHFKTSSSIQANKRRGCGAQALCR